MSGFRPFSTGGGFRELPGHSVTRGAGWERHDFTGGTEIIVPPPPRPTPPPPAPPRFPPPGWKPPQIQLPNQRQAEIAQRIATQRAIEQAQRQAEQARQRERAAREARERAARERQLQEQQQRLREQIQREQQEQQRRQRDLQEQQRRQRDLQEQQRRQLEQQKEQQRRQQEQIRLRNMRPMGQPSPTAWKPNLQSKTGQYWDWVRSDLRADLGARGISGSEWFWNDSQNAIKVMGLLAKLENMNIWPLVGKITEVWFGPTVYGMKFTPKNKTDLLTQLDSSSGLIRSVGSGSSKWHFRDLSSVNSLHIHGNGEWEAHIDTFHAYANPIMHGLIDYLPGKIQNLLRKK